MLDLLHYEDFVPHVNSSFHVRFSDEVQHDFTLVSVVNKPLPKQEQFVLTFRAPADAPKQQWLCQVSHPVLGEAGLFLVPVEANETGVTFAAIFNRPL